MKLLDVAIELFEELESPTDLSANAIFSWLRGNVGVLNNRIFTSYSLTTSFEITPELDEQTKAIFKKLYLIYYYGLKIRANLGAASYDILELTQDGNTVRKVNRNELSKSYIQMKKLEGEELDALIRGYKSKSAAPRQVVGDDTDSTDQAYNWYDRSGN